MTTANVRQFFIHANSRAFAVKKQNWEMQFRLPYLTTRLFILLAAITFLFVGGYFFSMLLAAAKAALYAAVVLTAVDLLLLYRTSKGVTARRELADRLSNGDDNEVKIHLANFYGFRAGATVIDEIPFQFQRRDFVLKTALPAGTAKSLAYSLRPVERGEYHFGAINVYISSPLGLATRRFTHEQARRVPVYPSYLQMRRYELYAISNRLTEAGIKKVRRLGHTLEFEQIREYVAGDDYRTINWKAAARKAELMVNQYEDEKSQQVYAAIDMGRVMKMPFAGMSLLDYAINASLVISNIAIHKQDKAGIITFSNMLGTVLPADRKATQMARILEILYNQETRYPESNCEALFAALKHKIRQRSLVLLFTNFETLSSLQRQLPYLRSIAGSHLLVAIFFENTELAQLLENAAATTEQIYLKTIAEKFAFEKRQIVKELQRFGIHAILTAPPQLTVNTINKYLELKARGLI
jgi:uncharacterized protein (DUF58 family)